MPKTVGVDDSRGQTADRAPTGPASGHEPALDGIRLFAFVAVFWFHVWSIIGADNLLFITLPPGEGGVRAFFVLSGFLIGGILLNARDSHAVPVWEKLRTFYARRSLRIFPAYYFVLIISTLLGAAGLHELRYSWTDPWDWFYLINVAIHFGRAWPGAQAHLWTLAVEEQFYLVAPLVILALSNRKISWICVFVWIGTTILRFPTSSDQFYAPLPWMQCDSLTLGIAAAIMQRDGRFLGISPRAFGIAGIVFGVLAVPTNYFPWLILGGPLNYLFGNKPAMALLTTCMGLGQWLLSAAVAALILAFWNGRGGAALIRRTAYRLPREDQLRSLSLSLLRPGHFHLLCSGIEPSSLARRGDRLSVDIRYLGPVMALYRASDQRAQAIFPIPKTGVRTSPQPSPWKGEGASGVVRWRGSKHPGWIRIAQARRVAAR